MVKTVETHCGTSIWCIEASDDDIIFTGGGDGSVNLTPFPNLTNAYLTTILLESKTEFVHKYVSFVDENNIILLSNVGKDSLLHSVEISSENMKFVDLPKYLSSYYIIEPSLNKQFIAIGSISGEVTIYESMPYKLCFLPDH